MQDVLTKIADFLAEPARITKLDYIVVLVVLMVATWS